MPCFNAAETLAEAVDSIRAQTLQDWELIILDDDSSDASPRIAADYQAADARIRCRAIPHQGIVAALQHACEEAAATSSPAWTPMTPPTPNASKDRWRSCRPIPTWPSAELRYTPSANAFGRAAPDTSGGSTA